MNKTPNTLQETTEDARNILGINSTDTITVDSITEAYQNRVDDALEELQNAKGLLLKRLKEEEDSG